MKALHPAAQRSFKCRGDIPGAIDLSIEGEGMVFQEADFDFFIWRKKHIRWHCLAQPDLSVHVQAKTKCKNADQVVLRRRVHRS